MSHVPVSVQIIGSESGVSGSGVSGSGVSGSGVSGSGVCGRGVGGRTRTFPRLPEPIESTNDTVAASRGGVTIGKGRIGIKIVDHRPQRTKEEGGSESLEAFRSRTRTLSGTAYSPTI